MKRCILFYLLFAFGVSIFWSDKLLDCIYGQQQKLVSLEEARKIAADFVGEEGARRMKYLGRSLRKTFPPFRMGYRFEIPSPVESQPLGFRIWVDEETGMVVELRHDIGYPEAKYKYRSLERPKENELISEAKAIEIAKRILVLARIPAGGIRLKSITLYHPKRDDRRYFYVLDWAKYVHVKGIGEVEFPTTISIEIDALTGELDKFLFKEFPVVLSLSPPKISEGMAIELARRSCKLQKIYATRAHLKIEVPVEPDWDNSREVELWANDPPQFYEKISLKRQALVWEVVLTGEYIYPYGKVPEPKDAEWEGIVCAATGRVEGKRIIPLDPDFAGFKMKRF